MGVFWLHVIALFLMVLCDFFILGFSAFYVKCVKRLLLFFCASGTFWEV